YYAGAAEDLLPKFSGTAAAAVLDPPRRGCEPSLLKAVASLAPERIVYISCNPATLARDVGLLREHGYALARIEAVDMFPQTEHVETVCLLYHQKKDFIYVPYEPKDAEYLKNI
ncbi:MAG: 23S rRNA (uracil(1939)-C(5))-methyltransferase RlmD, partial [Lachnospiraceae bacterium]|nr:23S rRNA (uracil(1939)-C(5))-methyltransferase RlmD [Lachnospiraceae bacterium]